MKENTYKVSKMLTLKRFANKLICLFIIPKPLVGRSNCLGSTSNIRVLGFGSRLFFCISENICFAFGQGAVVGAFLAMRFFASRVCSCYCVESRIEQVLVSFNLASLRCIWIFNY